MTGITHHDLALLWLERLRLQGAQFDMRNKGVFRSEYCLDEAFFEFVRLAGPSLFMEVGAHDGQRAVRAKAENPSARVVALEASPTNYAAFAAAHDFEGSQVEYMNLAAAESEGEVTFNLMPDLEGVPAGNSSLLASSAEDSEQVTVSAVPLDTFLPEAGRVALWVDVEGAAEAVLGGARHMLDRVDVLKIEVEDRAFWKGQWLADDVLALLLQYGLVPVGRDRTTIDGQYNVLLLSRSLYRSAEVSDVLMRFLTAVQARELPGPIGRLRRDPRVREVARRVVRR